MGGGRKGKGPPAETETPRRLLVLVNKPAGLAPGQRFRLEQWAPRLARDHNITLDFILDERSRELYAEDTRWWDLCRTKKLVERVQLYNAEGKAGVQPYNMLRPIPQSQIDLVTEGPPYPQNPGYQ